MTDKAPAPLITVYYWRRGFALLAPSFVLDRQDSPYQRLSATLLFAAKAPFTLETGENDHLEAQAALIAPKVPRRRIMAVDSEITICDFAVGTAEFNMLSPLLGDAEVRALDADRLSPLQGDFARARNGELSATDFPDLLRGAVTALSGQPPTSPRIDPRIEKTLARIEETPLREANLESLADHVHLSPSRLRHLFSEEMGVSLSAYLRWATVWRGIWLWSRGTTLLELVETLGFHDPAHLNRAFNAVFGLNPSYLFKPEQVRLVRCDWERTSHSA